MARSRGRWGLLLLAARGAAACGENAPAARPGERPDAGVNVVRPGLGDDPGEPLGTPLVLPPGVTLAGPVRGADDLTSECESGTPPHGSGVYVQVCVPLQNSAGAPVEVVFPPGLVIVSAAEGFQNGLLVERVVVTVPPTPPGPGGPPADGGVASGAHVVTLHTYCLNASRNPNELGTPYRLGSVTSDEALRELLGLLAGRSVDSEDDVDVVQDAIYSITEGRGLTERDRADLARL